MLFNHDQCNDVFRYRNKVRMWLDRLTNRFTDQIIAVSQSTRDFLLEIGKNSTPQSCIDLQRRGPGTIFPGLTGTTPGMPPPVRLFGNRQSGSGSRQIAGPEKFPRFSGGGRVSQPIAPEVRFVIAGEGPDRASLENLAAEPGHCRPGAVSGFCDQDAGAVSGQRCLIFPEFL